MTANYQTLDDYLDALDAIKEKVAVQTDGMTAKQVKAYFARARQQLQAATGKTLRLRSRRRKTSRPQP